LAKLSWNRTWFPSQAAAGLAANTAAASTPSKILDVMRQLSPLLANQCWQKSCYIINVATLAHFVAVPTEFPIAANQIANGFPRV
jgi:hypothetical protein